MNRTLGAAVSLLACLSFGQDPSLQPRQGPPRTRTDNVQEVLHGVTVTDPYRWLEDQNSPETRAWIQEENSYTHSFLDRWPGRQRVEKRFGELERVESISSPFERNGRYFYRKRLADQELYAIYMRQGDTGQEVLLIDPLPMSPDHSTNVDIFDVSKDGRILAYLIRAGGKDESAVHLFDVDARRDLTDRLPEKVYFDVSFLPDGSGLYYSLMADDGPRVRFHQMGTDAATDLEVFGKGYTKEAAVVGDPSEDGRHLIIQVLHGSAADKTEIWLQDLTKKGPIEPLVKDLDARFFAYAGGDQLFLHTNWKAPHGRVLAVDFANPARDRWREVVPESDTAIDNVTLAGGKILVIYVRNVSSQVKVFRPDGKLVGQMSFPALGSVEDTQTKWENRDAFIRYSSFAIPPTIYRYDTAAAKQSVWAQVKAPVDSSKFELQQVWFASKDGTKVPMFLLHAKGTQLDGSSPTLLTGYGGFTVSNTPDFDPDAIVWVERGGVYALANLRGGGEFGEAWHLAGMRDKKQNVFDDFIAASEWLIQNKYTQPSKLAILGGSNGGWLVGAALTQHPELYKAVVCWPPLLGITLRF